MNKAHIFSDFNEVLKQLKIVVLSMAEQVRHQSVRSVSALVDSQINIACTVIADDAQVDELERKVDQLGMEILLRFQPVASDLRLVITSMKLAHHLERISDHAVTMAKRTRRMLRSHEVPDPLVFEKIQSLHLQSIELFDKSIAAYDQADAELGASLKALDKLLDKKYKALTLEFSQNLEKDASMTEMWLDLIFVLRSIERMGDLSVNMGEDAVFLGDARDIRHSY